MKAPWCARIAPVAAATEATEGPAATDADAAVADTADAGAADAAATAAADAASVGPSAARMTMAREQKYVQALPVQQKRWNSSWAPKWAGS